MTRFEKIREIIHASIVALPTVQQMRLAPYHLLSRAAERIDDAQKDRAIVRKIYLESPFFSEADIVNLREHYGLSAKQFFALSEKMAALNCSVDQALALIGYWDERAKRDAAYLTTIQELGRVRQVIAPSLR